MLAKKICCLSVVLLLVSGCFPRFERSYHNSDYIFISKPINLKQQIKQGKTCSTSPQTNKEMIFETAKKAGIVDQIVLIEKTEEAGQYCTVVYGN